MAQDMISSLNAVQAEQILAAHFVSRRCIYIIRGGKGVWYGYL